MAFVAYKRSFIPKLGKKGGDGMEEYTFSILNSFKYVLRKKTKEEDFLIEFELFRNGYDISVWTFYLYNSYSNSTGRRTWQLIDDIPSFKCAIDNDAYNEALKYLKENWEGKEA